MFTLQCPMSLGWEEVFTLQCPMGMGWEECVYTAVSHESGMGRVCLHCSVL